MPIVDVRPHEMYEMGRIPSAIDIPLEDHGGSNEEAAAALSRAFRMHALSMQDPIIIYCQVGVHAKIACDLLESQGYDHLYLYSGSYQDWVSDPDNPIER